MNTEAYGRDEFSSPTVALGPRRRAERAHTAGWHDLLHRNMQKGVLDAPACIVAGRATARRFICLGNEFFP